MVKLTNPLNKDGILYEKGAILNLTLKTELELIANGLAEAYLSKGKEDKKDVIVLKEEKAQEESIEGKEQKDLERKEETLLEETQEEPKEEIQEEPKEESKDEVKSEAANKETKKASTRIGRTNKK